MKYIKKIFAVILTAVLVFSLVACSNSSSNDNSNSEELTDITVCLDWTPNTNHTGLYVADALGYYKDAGLNVTIVQPPENGAVEACSAGQVEFAIDAQDTLAAGFTSDTPMEVTAVAALIQHNTSGIISLKGQGMDSPKGLEGNTYLTWDSPIELAMMENVVTNDGGNWDKVTRIPNTVTDEAQDIKENPDHAIWVFAGWGNINAEVNGIDTDFFYFKDINSTFDYYTPILIANNEFLNSNPDTAKAFLEATKKGYEYAIKNPDESAQMLIDGDDTQSLVGSEELVKASQEWLSDQYISDAEQWGYIDAERWDNFYAWLYDNQLIEKEIPAGTGFSNDYLS
jgi:ABC-type nitrate/sulfonate/bicarbonate transport system substrate-binding protein